MEKREFGKTADGREAGLYILKNEKGMESTNEITSCTPEKL